MPKKILEDMMKSKGSSRSGTPVRITRSTRPVSAYVEQPSEHRHAGYGKVIGVLLAIFVIGIGVFFVSDFFSYAKVEVIPRQTVVTLNQSFSAVRGGQDGPLHFEVVQLTATDSLEVPAKGTEKVEKKASGKIVVYNAYSSEPQKLVENTRFRSSDGKIFRIKAPLIVPGATKDGTTAVPGSVEVLVEADQPGPEYNIGLTDFKIPGFEGSPKFQKFYARSKEKMSGGFSGQMKIASPEAIKVAQASLQEKLGKKLLEEVVKEVPEGYMGYPSGMLVTYTDTSDAVVASGTSSDTFTVQGTVSLRGVILNSAELAKAVAQKTIQDYDGLPVELSDVRKLAFNLSGKESFDPDKATEIVFTLEGSTRLVWLFDEDLLRNKIAGVKKDEYVEVFREFPMIETATTTLSPFWVRRTPRDIAKITVERVLR